eukprot:Unigene5824_Nuclearia_a/m.17796 Unigene5824_Nuclearia_a/g.17796  ORF Unigene5824_Nuclearia_a/g.17796 Unigene5824_Nuclearia_a/m.17796 type:complete len:355 (-) Unigene5824_Nuclearia_a:35-1099(-)
MRPVQPARSQHPDVVCRERADARADAALPPVVLVVGAFDDLDHVALLEAEVARLLCDKVEQGARLRVARRQRRRRGGPRHRRRRRRRARAGRQGAGGRRGPHRLRAHANRGHRAGRRRVADGPFLVLHLAALLLAQRDRIVKRLGGLGRRDLALEQLARRDVLAVEGRVRVFPLDEDGAFERDAGEDALGLAVRVRGGDRGHGRALGVAPDRASRDREVAAERNVAAVGEGVDGGVVVEDDDKVRQLRAHLQAGAERAGADAGRRRPGAVGQPCDDHAEADAAAKQEAGLEHGEDDEALGAADDVVRDDRVDAVGVLRQRERAHGPRGLAALLGQVGRERAVDHGSAAGGTAPI